MADKIDLPDADKETNKYSLIGFIITSIYLVIVSILVCTQWDDIINMKPNEWGDFMAGIFGPLALLWVVLGFLQQGVELKNSRKALLLQAEELRNSVEAQKDLGKAAWEQVNLEKNIQFSMKHEAKRTERRLERERRKSVEPRILMTSAGGGIGNGERYVNFVMENQGQTCIDLKIAISESNYSISKTRVDKVDPSEKVDLRLTLPFRKEHESCILSIVYEDIEGNSYSKGYAITSVGGAIPKINLKGHDQTDC